MDIAYKFEKIRVFFTDDGLVSVLEEVAGPLMPFVEGDGVSGHQFAHDLAERGRASAQEKVKMVRDQGPGITLGLGFFQNDGKAVEERLAIRVIEEELAPFDASGHDVLEEAGGV